MKRSIFTIAICIVLVFTGYLFATVTEKLEVAWDKKGPIHAISQSSHIDARVLAADTAESHTVPDDADYVVFAAQDGSGDACSFYADFSGTAAEPAADITDGSGSELNPSVRSIAGVTTISLLAPETCLVTMSFYQGSF